MSKKRAFFAYALLFFISILILSCGERKISLDSAKSASGGVDEMPDSTSANDSFPMADENYYPDSSYETDSEPKSDDMNTANDEVAPFPSDQDNAVYSDNNATPDDSYYDSDVVPSIDEQPYPDEDTSADGGDVEVGSCDCTNEPLFEPVCCNGTVTVYNNCYANCLYKNNQICTSSINENSCGNNTPAQPSCTCIPNDFTEFKCTTTGEVVVSECLAGCICGNGNYTEVFF